MGDRRDAADFRMQEQAIRPRLVDRLAVPVIVVAGGLAYLAEKFALPGMIPIAIAFLGAFALLLGVDTVIHGRIQLFDRLYSRREHYSGLSARLLGSILSIFGAGLILYAASEWLQPGEAGPFLEGLVRTDRGWGILLITFGFFALLFGLIRVISGSAHGPEQHSAWVDIGFRIQGLVGCVVGALLLFGGVWPSFK